MVASRTAQAFARRWKALLVTAALPASLLASGCQNPSHTDEGVVGGAVVGGILGTIIGAAARNPAAGAAIGAGAGAVIGGAEGAARDHAEKKEIQQAVAEQQQRALGLYDVVKLVYAGTSDAVIINQIRTSGAVYNLRAVDIEYLQQNHVSDAIIREMQNTALQRPVRVVGPGPVVVEQPAVIVEPPVGVGVIYTRRRW